LPEPFVFDKPVQSEAREAKIEFLRPLIAAWKSELNLQTALDLGCGVGHFSAMLQDLGFQVTAADARAQNIAEARSRHPGIVFHVADAEDAFLPNLGTFDLVLCLGLLYHLENPMRAVRSIRALTSKVLLLEGLTVPDDQPFFILLDEPDGNDQSLRAVSCYPSDGAMIKMSYCAGFPHVYNFRELPKHVDYRAAIGRKRARNMIAASVPTLNNPLLEIAPEPKPSRDLWTTDPTGITNSLRRLRRNLKVSRSRKRS
jgi:SAM-dependent methyltransferase